jgi:hypothetical protein
LRDGKAQLGRLRPGQNYHFFRTEVAPIWEDGWNAKVNQSSPLYIT